MDMDILSWNCRGICNDTTTRALKDLISQNRPQIIFLCETKISRKEDFQKLHRALGFAHSETVLSEGQSGGLAVFWNDDVRIRMGTTSAHHMDMVVEGNPGDPTWRLTGFYGFSRTAERDRSWRLLRELSDLDFLPWIVVGDFNEILNNDEKIDGPRRAEHQMRGFREALGYGELLDLGFQGTRTTWWNSETKLRLDRAVCTPSWYDIFGYAKVVHLPPSDSDHNPLLLRANAWQTDVTGDPMYRVTQKIKHTRMTLDKWQKNTFRVRKQSMLGVRGRLEELMDVNINDAVQAEKKDLMSRLQTLLSQEETFWKQRSKVQWLKEGDRNTGFFHRKAANRKRKNLIPGLYDEDGTWCEDDAGMERIVSSYFTKMFTASELDFEAMDTTISAIQPCVSHEMNEELCRQYTREEIKCALFQMYPTKSPGPDGMPPLFFQHYWETIGEEVTEAVQNFLHTGQLFKQINFTHICLIPKVSNPATMSDLRPIALCNVIYKLCSKAIANRLKVILPGIISPFQSAFVPGRLITDNILVANEMAHFVHNKREGSEGFMALKLDLSKAYDRMEWLFLRKVMNRFGFAQVWIDMVMLCVTTVRYSFLVRGKPRGFVIPSRGLRQGDPLSPYLFLIGAEGFSALLQKKQRDGLLSGIELCRDAPSVNHLLFADDSMLYANACLEDCYQIQDVIETYGRASGQLVNFNKSSVVFSKNVSEFMQEEVSSLLRVEIVDSHEKYLGLPTYVGRKKTETFQYIKDNLAKKVTNWQGKFLSGAGKDVLIRVVAQALPTYAMSVFQLTKCFCEDLEQMCARFWWGSSLDKRKIHWQSWDALCNPNEEGGLGFRSLSEFNSAMLAKQAWRIINNPSSLIARLYEAKYFPGGTFWTAEAHASPSYSWRSIFSTRELIVQGSLWQIGDGEHVRAWVDPWVSGIPNHIPTVLPSNVNTSIKVSEFMTDSLTWNDVLVRNTFSVEDAEAILSIPLSTRIVEDRCVWKLERDGVFSVKTAYRKSFSLSPSRRPNTLTVNGEFWKKIWRGAIPSSARVHAWRVCNNILPSLERLAAKHVVLESQLCVLCEAEQEKRNNRVWEQKKSHAVDVALRACTRLAEFRVHNVRVPSVGQRTTVTSWKHPPLGVLKANYDGSFNPETKRGGLGFVIRDSSGILIAGGARPLNNLLSAEHAEVLACQAALAFVRSHNMMPVILETDSSLVQRQVSSRATRNTSLLGRIYDDIVEALRFYPNVSILHTMREANLVAHLIADHAKSLQYESFFFSTPTFLMAAVAAECHVL
ncbi:uncharacterized protein LOC133727086 [Rosa rugosa]|uniref:uncharacterized protein LOC133727086 n=1 Tax=Rosa rugosa TaxID=74645 RepID=UPI002B406BB4|nr:uncharacterized protein LOC133727086 [Rosa rugosa]